MDCGFLWLREKTFATQHPPAECRKLEKDKNCVLVNWQKKMKTNRL
jgi:hypothetical protein